MKKFISLFLSLVIIFCFSGFVNSHANTIATGGIYSRQIDNEIITYAENNLHIHLNSYIRDNLLPGIITEYSLGEPFTVHNVYFLDAYTIYFPVLRNNCIKGIMEIHDSINEYTSTFSESFSNNLSELLLNNRHKKFILLTDGYFLKAFDGNSFTSICELFTPENDEYEFPININLNNFSSNRFIPFNALTTPTYAIHNDNTCEVLALDGPRSYKTLNVPYAAPNGAKCWASTCASIINFFNGSSITAPNVASYIYPNNISSGGTISDMQDAYTHWGISSTSKNGILTSSQITTNIKANKPIHMMLTGTITASGKTSRHTVGLIGYEDYSNTGNGYVIILLDPNFSSRKTTTLKSNGNIQYYVNKGTSQERVYTWSETIYF